MTASPFPSVTSARSRQFDLFGSLRRRILASIAAVVAWLGLTLIYLAFWAHEFTLFQSIVIVLVSFLAMGAALVAAWISFGLAFAGRSID